MIRDLSRREDEVTVLDRAPNVQEVAENRSINYLQGDITNKALVNEAVQGKDVNQLVMRAAGDGYDIRVLPDLLKRIGKG